MRSALIGSNRAGANLFGAARGSSQHKLESGDDKQRARNRDQVLEHRNDKIRNLERPHQPAAHPVPRKRSHHAADRTQSTSDRGRLPASKRYGRARKPSQENSGDQARRFSARRRRRKLIRHQLGYCKNREDRHGSRRSHE